MLDRLARGRRSRHGLSALQTDELGHWLRESLRGSAVGRFRRDTVCRVPPTGRPLRAIDRCQAVSRRPWPLRLAAKPCHIAGGYRVRPPCRAVQSHPVRAQVVEREQPRGEAADVRPAPWWQLRKRGCLLSYRVIAEAIPRALPRTSRCPRLQRPPLGCAGPEPWRAYR